MSCGQLAFERAGIKVNKYFASEIADSSIKVAQKNYPNTIQLGNVLDIKGNNIEDKIDVLIGGSPCQSFSFAGKQEGMATDENIEVVSLDQYLELKDSGFIFKGQSYLFWEYVRILKEIRPKYFLLENVKMAKKWEIIITEALGVEPIKIDSGLVSAQTRERLYWTNIPNIIQPEDKEIVIDDILEKNIEHKYLPKTRQEYTNYNIEKVDKSIHKSTPIQLGSSKQFRCSVRSNGKAFTIRKTECNGIIDDNYDIRKYTPIEVERLQTVPDNYTLCDGVSNTRRYEMLGDGWTIDVIAHILSYMEF